MRYVYEVIGFSMNFCEYF